MFSPVIIYESILKQFLTLYTRTMQCETIKNDT